MNSNAIKIAYIGGGSKNWAWKLMSDLAVDGEISGEVALYDLDHQAALANEKIGNGIGQGGFRYKAVETLAAALAGADFVVISILPGTLEEMASDVHTPEAYGIYQSVGDTAGPGGIVRAMRTIPMYVDIAHAIEKHAPTAWVINYTNPMTMCVDTLYHVFPGIRAFGCCHEVFSTQRLLAAMLEEMKGLKDVPRQQVRVNVKGVNHFTWIDAAHYRDIDLMPLYAEFAKKHREAGIDPKDPDEGDGKWMFSFKQKVKFDLFLRYGIIAAAGDRHLAEFCPGTWYLRDPQTADSWGFGITTVEYRRQMQREKDAQAAEMAAGTRPFKIDNSGEEGVVQMKAIMGLGDLVTNVNLPNRGQIDNLERGRVVETNAHFTAGRVTPVQAGPLPAPVHAMVATASDNCRTVVESCLRRDLAGCLPAFTNDPLVAPLPPARAEELFWKMVKNTEKYLAWYR